MLRDLLDSLRCPRPHEESWLVAMVHRADGPTLIDAELACPVCGAEFRISDGVAHFDEVALPARGNEVDPLRLAAQLGVTEGWLPILLAGEYAAAGRALAEMVPVPQLWLNAHASATAPGALFSTVEVRGRVPLGVHTLAGAAVDHAHADAEMLDSIVRAVTVGGRIVAPAHVPLPSAVRELARDDAEWVAEVTARASGLVELRRRAPEQVG